MSNATEIFDDPSFAHLNLSATDKQLHVAIEALDFYAHSRSGVVFVDGGKIAREALETIKLLHTDDTRRTAAG
jgi:hypothetical protein